MYRLGADAERGIDIVGKPANGEPVPHIAGF
jgi:hypothetical protein